MPNQYKIMIANLNLENITVVCIILLDISIHNNQQWKSNNKLLPMIVAETKL